MSQSLEDRHKPSMMRIFCLRNPVQCWFRGCMGRRHFHDSFLMPQILHVALKKREALRLAAWVIHLFASSGDIDILCLLGVYCRIFTPSNLVPSMHEHCLSSIK